MKHNVGAVFDDETLTYLQSLHRHNFFMDYISISATKTSDTFDVKEKKREGKQRKYKNTKKEMKIQKAKKKKKNTKKRNDSITFFYSCGGETVLHPHTHTHIHTQTLPSQN